LAGGVRIALVSPYDHQTPGGVREHVVNLDRQLREMGHETRVIAPASTSRGLAANVDRISGWIVPLRVSGSVARISPSLAVLARMRRLFARYEFDVVHLHEPLIPTVSLFALLNARSAMVGTIHGYRDASAVYRVGRPVLSRLMRRLSGRTAVSVDAMRWATRYFPGDYRIISDGVDVRRFADPSIRPLEDFADGKLNVLFVGRLEPRKGLGYLLSALPKVSALVAGVRLIVAGAYSPRDQRAWMDAARSAGDVVFTGPVPADRLPRLYRSADVFCAPSTGFEALGIVLLEAMASGLPIVTTDIEGYRTVVTHEREGLVVRPRDSTALAAALTALLLNPGRRAELAAAGRVTVQRYDWGLLARQYVDLYGESAERFALSSSGAAHRRRRRGGHAST
jgi:phosphatidylinositol alpha-mannosyltransferase